MAEQSNVRPRTLNDLICACRNIDQSINDIIDLVSRDYVLHWIEHLVTSDTEARAIFKRDFWVMVNNLSARLSQVKLALSLWG